MAKAAPAEQIEQLLEDYRNRGEMTWRGFCERRGMTLSTLDYYLRRYRSGAKAESAKLVRVNVKAAETSGIFTLVLANGRRIESAWNFAGLELARLIRVVEGA